MKTLTSIVAGVALLTTTGCQVLNPMNYFGSKEVAPVVEEVKIEPAYLTIKTTHSGPITYTIPGGDAQKNKLRALSYHVGVERGIITSGELETYDLEAAKFMTTYIATMDKDWNLTLTNEEIALGSAEVYKELEDNRAALTQRVRNDIVSGRKDANSVSNGTEELMPLTTGDLGL